MKKKRICYVTPLYEPFVGGAEISLRNISQSMPKHISATVLTSLTDEKGTLLKQKTKEEKGVIRVGFNKRIPIANSKEWKANIAENLLKELEKRKDDFDLIYLNNHLFASNKQFLDRIARLNKPVILKIIYTKAFDYLQGIKKHITSKDNLWLNIHCISEEIKGQALEFGFSKHQLFVCSNPVDTRKFSYQKNTQLQKKLGIAKDDIVYFFSGRFSPQKNIDKIVQTFLEVEKRTKNVKLLMIGECNHKEMQPLVDELKKSSKNILWPGKIKNADMPAYLSLADILLMASKDEGMSNSFLEALSVGLCPVVPSHVSGMKDIIGENINGFLYELEDPSSIIETLSQLSKKQIKTYGKRAQNYVTNNHHISTIVGKHLDFYEETLEKKELAFCTIIHNEEKTIEKLIKIIKEETFPDHIKKRLIIYTDKPTDMTEEIITKLSKKHQNFITHIKGTTRKGKPHGFNKIKQELKDHEVAIFFDGDVVFSKGAARNLYAHLLHYNYHAVSPLLLGRSAKKQLMSTSINNLHQKRKRFMAKHDLQRYLSGRTYAIHAKHLKEIPKELMFEDIFLNLSLPHHKIGLCKTAEVYYHRPSTIKDIPSYGFRQGKAFSNLKKHHPTLWKKQKQRLPFLDYAFFRLTKKKYIRFIRTLTTRELLLFLLIRTVHGTAMSIGFLFSKADPAWKPLPSTKQ